MNKSLVAAVATLILSACGGSDNNPTPTPTPTATPTISSCPTTIGNLTPMALAVQDGRNRCQISGVLTSDGTLSNTNNTDWELEGLLQIGDDSNSATLTVDAGTTIYGDNTDMVDHVFVYPGSAISANGTGANPVRFLSDDDDVNGSGEWGGIFIRGDGENLLDYVVVAEAGAAVDVAGTTYMDNIVLNSVTQNTRLTFVQSHDSARDGIRIQNGNPRLSWILVTGATRDGIWYRDFNGLIKDLMVIHRPTTGRAGIYTSESSATTSFNPRIVNATLVGRDGASVDASADTAAREFGILFADNTDEGRFANILIANFRNGCYETSADANLSNIPSTMGGNLGYLDGIHCANEAGANPNFAVLRENTNGLTVQGIGNGNGDGFRYYNGATNPVTFTGETTDRLFTAGWYLFQLGIIPNGLAADANSLNAFNDGDTNNDGNVNADDVGATPFLGVAGANDFNTDVAADTGGYDLTHIGAVRSGSDASSAQFNGWTVATGTGEGFAVPNSNVIAPSAEAPVASTCPAVGNLTPTSLMTVNGRNRCQLSGTLTADASIDGSVIWELEGLLQVGDDSNTATLTIAAGTNIYGDNVDAVDHLFVYPGSGIQANGTAASPVRFLSDDSDMNGTGEWGGLFIRGTGDNLLDYVVVAEAGAATMVAGTTYQDNIVLNSVDENTRLTFVQSHDSARDGIRIQNGSPRLSWILVTGATRDGIWYRDFSGLIKDLMVIHRPSTGRSGIYASETVAGDSNPRIVNATLVGRDGVSVDASADTAASEFGILFADNTDQARFANILIANFRNGCYEADEAADLSAFDATIPGPVYLDGIHCANEAGANSNFAVVRAGSQGLPASIQGIGNGDGLRYYNGATNPITFTGENAPRAFTSGWYLFTIGSLTNGLAADSAALNGFNDGDTNNDGNTDTADIGFAPFLNDSSAFSADVAGDTGGYDLTHIGSVRSGSRTSLMNRQFDGWTIQTGAGQGFAVPAPVPAAP